MQLEGKMVLRLQVGAEPGPQVHLVQNMLSIGIHPFGFETKYVSQQGKIRNSSVAAPSTVHAMSDSPLYPVLKDGLLQIWAKGGCADAAAGVGT